MGRNIKRNVKIFGYGLIIIVAFELLLRLLAPGLSYFYNAACYFRYGMYDNKTYWINKPGYHNSTVTINSWGYRSPEIGKKNNKRLLILGDSIAFGWGLKQNEVFVNFIKGYEVINTAVPGTNSEEQLRLLQQEGLSFNPDIVLWIVTNNDLAGRSKQPTRLQKNLYRSYLLTALFYIKKRLRHQSYTTEQYEHADDIILQMAETCSCHNVKLLCCLYGKNEVTDYYQKVLINLKVNNFIVPEKITKLKINSVDGHLNHIGHKLLAGIIQQVLRFYD